VQATSTLRQERFRVRTNGRVTHPSPVRMATDLKIGVHGWIVDYGDLTKVMSGMAVIDPEAPSMRDLAICINRNRVLAEGRN
jgi:hypothetical protein